MLSAIKVSGNVKNIQVIIYVNKSSPSRSLSLKVRFSKKRCLYFANNLMSMNKIEELLRHDITLRTLD